MRLKLTRNNGEQCSKDNCNLLSYRSGSTGKCEDNSLESPHADTKQGSGASSLPSISILNSAKKFTTFRLSIGHRIRSFMIVYEDRRLEESLHAADAL